jgi:hypothetical protein
MPLSVVARVTPVKSFRKFVGIFCPKVATIGLETELFLVA